MDRLQPSDLLRHARVLVVASSFGLHVAIVVACLRAAGDDVLTRVAQRAVAFAGGSLDGMAAGVDEALGEILDVDGLEELAAANRYRRDLCRTIGRVTPLAASRSS